MQNKEDGVKIVSLTIGDDTYVIGKLPNTAVLCEIIGRNCGIHFTYSFDAGKTIHIAPGIYIGDGFCEIGENHDF